MIEVIVLAALAFIWIIAAVARDFKIKEVPDWLNYSLVIFALGFRFFYSLFSPDANGFAFFYQGLIGFGIFFVLENLFYYGKLFGGGDAKLLMALGPILPFSENFMINLKIFGMFFIIFLFVGAAYGLLSGLIVGLRNWNVVRKEFMKVFRKSRKIFYAVFLLGLAVMVLGFWQNLLFWTGALIFVMPYIYVYAKAVDEACMVKKVNSRNLREGDLLYENLKVGKKMIKAKWDGLSKEEIKLIRKHLKNVLLREGIAYTPVFLISFVITVILYLLNVNIFNWFS